MDKNTADQIGGKMGLCPVCETLLWNVDYQHGGHYGDHGINVVDIPAWQRSVRRGR